MLNNCFLYLMSIINIHGPEANLEGGCKDTKCRFGSNLSRPRFVSFAFSPFFSYSPSLQPAFVDFSKVNNAPVHCLRTHKFHFSVTFSLKMSPTILFTHLKIILLQCFQFSVSAK